MEERISLYQIEKGDPGVAQEIAKIDSLVHPYSIDWRIITLAREITRYVEAKNKRAESDALFWWVKQNIKFQDDPVPSDMFQSPLVTLKYGIGDCDDMLILLACLNMSIGNPVGYVTIAPEGESDFTHIFLATFDQFGEVTFYDPTVTESYPNWYPPRVSRARLWLSSLEYEDFQLSGWFKDIVKKVKKIFKKIDKEVKRVTERIYKEIKRVERKVRKEKDRVLKRITKEIARFEKKIGPWGKILLMGPLYSLPGNPLTMIQAMETPSLSNIGKVIFGENPWERLTDEEWKEIEALGGIADIFKQIKSISSQLYVNPVDMVEKLKKESKEYKKELKSQIEELKKFIENLKQVQITTEIERRAQREALAKLEADLTLLSELLLERSGKELAIGMLELKQAQETDELEFAAEKEVLKETKRLNELYEANRRKYLESIGMAFQNVVKQAYMEVTGARPDKKVNPGIFLDVIKEISL